MNWENILKVQPLLDTRKLRDYLGISQGPLDLMYEYKRNGLEPRLMVLGKTEGERNKEYKMTKAQLTDLNVEGKKMFMEGEYTLEELGDFTFKAVYTFDKKLVTMSTLPRLNDKKFSITMDDKFHKLTQNNDYGTNQRFRKQLINAVFGYLYDGFDNVEEYAGDYLLTGPRLSRDKNLERDKRGKQERFKEVLRKPDSSNVREFSELVENRLEPKVLPINEKIVRQLVEKGFFEYDESALERNDFPYTKTKKAKDFEFDGIPVNLYLDESLVEGDPSITIKDNEGEYKASLYAYFDFPWERGTTTSKERQKLIDEYKAFQKMSGKQILNEILG